MDGKQVYTANCVACHQATGAGLPSVFPPLDDSEWVIGEPRVLANILLHGVDGELTVKGTAYKGAMPAFGQLGDARTRGGRQLRAGELVEQGGRRWTPPLFAAERKSSRARQAVRGRCRAEGAGRRQPLIARRPPCGSRT